MTCLGCWLAHVVGELRAPRRLQFMYPPQNRLELGLRPARASALDEPLDAAAARVVASAIASQLSCLQGGTK